MLLSNTHKTRSYYHLVTAKPRFIHTTINCMHQTNLGREDSIIPSVITHSSYTKCVMMSVAVSQTEVVLCEA